MSRWLELLDRIRNPEGEVHIGRVRKYVQLEDAYKSLRKRSCMALWRQNSVRSWSGGKRQKSIRLPRRLRGCDTPMESCAGRVRQTWNPGMVHAIEYARKATKSILRISASDAVRDD